MTHRLTTNYAKNYRNRTLIVKVIVENVVICFRTQCRTRQGRDQVKIDIHCVQKKTPTHIFFHISISDA